MYLYLNRQFRWSESQIGVYFTYRMFVNGVGKFADRLRTAVTTRTRPQ